MHEAISKVLRQSGLAVRAEHEWSEFVQAYELSCGSLPNHQRVTALAHIFGRSFYLSTCLRQNPQLAQTVFATPYWERPKSRDVLLAELKQATATHDALPDFVQAVRRYRYQETLRQSVRELANVGDFIMWGYERSDLASACAEVTLNHCYQALVQEYGTPHAEDGSVVPFTVLGMGKLGGGDLNHSSDIDLIYLYGTDEGRLAGASGLSLHQFFVKLSERLTHALNERTQHGFIYRVDMDLRPEGNQGTLANSLDAMELYYETFGSNWERMAMTKAHAIAGSRDLGETLWQRLLPFVYPKTIDYSTLEQVRDLKQRIEQSLQQKMSGVADPQQPAYNLKLGKGGIREIEFFVGSFQRLFGGKNPLLQNRHTLSALSLLGAAGIVPQEEVRHLTEAYCFLRTVENRLQMREERQTHHLPKAREDLAALALSLDATAESADEALNHFYQRLLLYTTWVDQAFQRLLESR